MPQQDKCTVFVATRQNRDLRRSIKKMKKTIQLLSLIGLAPIFAGCATPYMIDRGRDASDIFTATVGAGLGAKARIGPLHVGILGSRDYAGLRGGRFKFNYGEDRDYCYDADLLFVPIGYLTGGDCFTPEFAFKPDRMKHFQSFIFIPFWYSFMQGERLETLNTSSEGSLDMGRESLHVYTQIEAVIAIGPSIRLGFNPGELLDFILGWTTIDIYNDDIEWKESNKTGGR
jgi:hypothetical protein